ncbi:MAG: hypothetical protein RLZ10_1296 [Bacteroidota bacterium]
MTSFLKKYYRLLRGCYIYLRYIIFRRKNTVHEDKLIFFELNHNRFERYFYLLCKFFLIEGYQIGIKINFNFLGNIERYSKLLLVDENVHFFWRNQKSKQFFQTNATSKKGIFLSDRYFDKSSENSYHVPMSLHPLMYQDEFWNEIIESTSTRKKAIFFAGSLEKGHYDRKELELKFGVFNRVFLANFLSKTKHWLMVDNFQEIENGAEKKIYFLDRNKVDVPMPILRKTLRKFSFFLACPGVSMPFSHNIIEAMSVGCIPIIEENYANLFNPKLIHLENAIIFAHDEENLKETIELAFTLDEFQINKMHNSVNDYYSSHLIPKSVLINLFDNQLSTCFLNAEAFSVSYIK